MANAAQDASGPASPKPGDIPPAQGSRPDSSDRGKLRVFISYSRDDLEFADQLDAALMLAALSASLTATASPVARIGSGASAT